MTVAAGPSEPTALATETPVVYVGLATRAVSAVIDAAVIDIVVIFGGIGAALILSLLHLTGPLKAVLAVIGAVVVILWSLGYFVVFWSTTGQTPGARVMQIRVVADDGVRIKPRRALLRCAGVILAALPLFAGFILILFDARRRGFQDRFARTLVIDAPNTSYIARIRAGRRAASEAAEALAAPEQP
jgi:uncharacterized RDD family membrane protein YckC